MTTIITPKDRNNSRQLDWHLWTDVPAMEAILRAIAPSIEKSHLKSRETNLQVMVTNLVAAYLLDPERYVAYSRRKKSYVKFARYNEQDLGYDPMVAISDSLQTEGWCEQITGDISPFAKERKLTRIRAAAKMVELIGRSGITLDAIGRHPDEELVILRDCKEAGEKKGKDIDYPESAFTHEARGRLRAYNNMLQRHRIDPPPLDVEVDPLYTYVRRIFANRSFNEGGRFYGGWWQSLNESQRASIRLDGLPVVELDYRGVHLYLAYRTKGLIYRDDPYDLASLPKDARAIAKTALLVLFNVSKKKSEAQGIQAVVAATRDAIISSFKDGEGGLNRKAVSRFSGVENIENYLKDGRLKEIVKQMIERHPDVADQFFTGIGNRLQRRDSDLADYVIGKFVELDKPILPIHDSFVVKEEDKLFLRTTMEDACREVLGFEPCEIKHALSWFG